MPIDYSCPSCGQTYQAPDHAAGKVRSCTSCGESLHIPNTFAAAAIPEAEIADEVVVTCPHCSTRLRLPPGSDSRSFRCPRCKELLESSLAEYADRVFEDYEPPRRRRNRQPDSSAGRTCAILSVIFGCVAFLLCPPLFGLAGLTLGIVGTVLSRDKGLGIAGIVLSVLGTLVGMWLGMLVWRAGM